MAIQGFFTGDVKIRNLNGVLKAVNGIVEVATDIGTVTGSGTTGYVPKWSSTTAIGDSLMYDAGSAILIGSTTAGSGKLMVYSSTPDNHYQAIGSAPSFRFADTIVSPSYTGIIGLATATNHFIIGAVAGDMVLANNTTSSIGNFIFGTGATERMRITPTGNVSIGGTGNTYKLDVTGTGRFSGQLRLESTITNGTYTYTLPGATGTIALVGGAGVGTVTSVAALTLGTSGTDLSSTVANSTTTPVITLNVPTASATNRGALSSADWTTFNSKQGAITLTTTGTSGAATLIGTTLNIPNYTPDLSGYVPTSRQLTINGTTYDLSANRSWSVGTVTSVGLTMPSAFAVSSSPVTGSGTISVTGAGNATQYIRGDGALATFPTNGGGGGASVSYYLNGSVNQGTFGGNTYYEMNKTPIIGAGTDFTINADGYIAQFITDANDPALLKIPAGNWNFETYFQASSGGGSPTFYIELYKYNGTTFTLIASNSGSPKLINDGTNIEAYFTALAVPETVLTLTDRIAIRIYVTHSGRTITLHTENSHLCQIITTFTTGLAALNGLTEQVQYLATGTSGTDFNISSAIATHTFNLPTASATNRGALSTADWTRFNNNIPAGTPATGDYVFYNGSNLAYRGLVANAPLSYNSSTATFSISQASGSTNGFLSSTDWTTFNSKQDAGNYITALTGEATATGPGSASVTLSTSAVTGKLLTGLNLTGGGSIAATDSILQAFGKVQNQISGMVGGVTYQGTWDASTNTPTLTSSVGTKGYYYIVSVAGSTNLNGITDWKIGDWAIFNGTTWDKVDNTDAVSSVNGFTGAVSLTTSNISEGTNLYYLDSRARLALSFTAGSGAYNSTTGVITIPTNTNQLTNGAAYITLASLSAGAGISYNNTTGVIASTITQYTDAMARASISGGTGISYNSTTGVITNTITQYTDAMARASISLTTTGTSGAATYNSTTGVLNVPQYAPDLSGYVPTSRTLTINGTAFDLSANRSWSVGTVTSVGLSSATSGVTIGSTPVTTSGTITLAIATASGSQQGLLSSTDWTTFNNKQNALTNPVTGTGTTNYLPKFTGTSTIGNSLVYDNGTSVFVNAITAPALGSPKFFVKMATANSYEGILVASSSNNNVIAIAHTGSLGLITTNYGTSGSNTPLAFGTNGSEQMRLDASGNLGLGVTPSAWSTGTRALQVGSYGALAWSGGIDISMTNNAYYDGTNWVYIASQEAGRFLNNRNTFAWFQAAAGTAGNAISFTQAMTLDASGRLGIGTTSISGSYRLTLNGDSSTNTGGIIIRQSGTDVMYIGNIAGSNTTDFEFWNPRNGYTRFATNNIERMRLNASGNLSVGNTNDIYKLDITSNAYRTFRIQSNDDVVMTFGSTVASSQYWSITASANGSGQGSNQFFIGRSTSNPSGLLTKDFTLSSTGAATFSSDVTIGAASQLYLTSGDLRYSSNAGFGIVSQNGNRLVSIQNGAFGVNGAATFSSSVTAAGGLISNGGSIGYGGGELGFGVTTSGATSGIYTLATGSPVLYFDHRATGNTGFWVWRSGTGGGTTALTLSNAGAATFSSSVTASGAISLSNNNVFPSGAGIFQGTGYLQMVSGANGFTINNNANTVTNVMVTNAGSVGIGTTSPANRLDVLGTAASPNLTGTNAYARFYQSGGYANITIGGLASGSFAGWLQSSDGVGTSLPLALQPNGGNVGIGTPSPAQLLTIQNTSSNPYLSIIGGASATMGVLLGTTGNTVDGQIIYSNSTQHMAFVTASAERMRITSGGNVGIGTTSPLSGVSGGGLQITNSTAAYVRVNATGFTGLDLIQGTDGTGYLWQRDNNDVRFGTNNTERMRITSGGTLLVGTTSEAFAGGKLQVEGTIRAAGQFTSVLPSSNFGYFDGSGQVVASASSASSLYLDATWNTTGNPDAIFLNITNTASGASAKLLNLKVGSVSQFNVSKAGAITTGALTNGTAQPWKLGNAVSGSLSTNHYIIVEINGTTYSIPALQGLP